jgi:hypothetical protein
MVMMVPMVVERSHYGLILGDQCRRVNCFSLGRGNESDQWGSSIGQQPALHPAQSPQLPMQK